MKNQTELEKRIVESLDQWVDHIEPHTQSMQQIKDLTSIQRKGRGKTMERIVEFFRDFRFKINKPVLTFCSIVVIGIASIQPVQAWALEGLNKAMEIIYTVVKGEDGNYEAVQVPNNNDQSYSTQEEVTDDAVNFAFKVPPALKNGYKLISTYIQVPFTAEGAVIDTIPDSIQKCYSKDESDCRIFLTASINDGMFAYGKDENYDGDTRKNRKEYTINEIPVYYFEDALPKHPLVIDPMDGKWTSDFTQEPIIKTTHIFLWEHDGVYYYLNDLGNLTFDEVKSKAEFIIEFQQEK